MTKRQIRKEIKLGIQNGKSKQAVFDELNETCGLEPEVLAKLVQAVPSLEARHKYRILHRTFIILNIISILISMLALIPMIIQLGFMWMPIVFLIPLVNIILLISAILFNPRSHTSISFIGIISIIQSKDLILDNIKEPAMLFSMAILIGIIVLGFYLNSKLCPSYKVVYETATNNSDEQSKKFKIQFEEESTTISDNEIDQ